MPMFRYVAKRGPHDTVEGLVKAETRAEVLAQLGGLGYIPIRVTEASAPAVQGMHPAVRDGRVPARQRNVFTRQFASLMHSQVPLLRALTILKEQASHPHLQRVIGAIAEAVRQGETLSDALASYPKIFSPLYVSLTRAGEVAGLLDTVLDRLAAQADREEALHAKVQGAVAYPLFVGVVGLGTVTFLLAFVLPRLVGVFQGFGGRLPLPTRVLMTMSAWFAHGWSWLLLAVGLTVLAAALLLRHERIHVVIDRVSLRLPLGGAFIRQLELARFARAFGLLLNHGVPILQAVEVAVPVIGHRVIRQALGRLSKHLKDGSSLAVCLKGMPIVTPFLVHTVAVGEEGGRVGEALTEVADFYERELDRLLEVMAALLEPVMILLVGGVVGFIVMAVLLPVFEMSVIAR